MVFIRRLTACHKSTGDIKFPLFTIRIGMLLPGADNPWFANFTGNTLEVLRIGKHYGTVVLTGITAGFIFNVIYDFSIDRVNFNTDLGFDVQFPFQPIRLSGLPHNGLIFSIPSVGERAVRFLNPGSLQLHGRRKKTVFR